MEKRLSDSSSALALWLLCAAYFAMGTSTLAIVGGLPAIAEGLKVPPDAVARLVSVFAITFALAAPGVQVLLGHWPRRRLLLGGLALATLGTVLSAAAPSYPMLFAARVLTALGAASIGPVASALGAGLVDRDQQGRALATVFLGMTLSSVLSVPASEWLAAHAGWRTMLAAVALLDAIVLAAVLLGVPRGDAGQRLALRDLLGLLRRPGLAAAVAVMLLQMAGLFASYTMIVPLLRERFALAPALVSLALLVFGLAGVLGNLVARRVAQRTSAARALAGALVALLLLFAALGLVPPHPALAFVLLALWAVANDVFMPSQQRRLVEMAPEARGLVLALNASALYVGMSSGAFVAGQVQAHAGIGTLPWASVALIAAALAALAQSTKKSGMKSVVPGVTL
jgi:DHA1 family inner membrane transport protein